MEKIRGSCCAVICIFLIWFSVIQALETRFRFERTFLQGASSKPYWKRSVGSSLPACALECGRWLECTSFSVRPSIQECRMYSSLITALDITPASASEEETFYWKHLAACPLEKGYTIVPGTNKCLQFHRESRNLTGAEATCEAEGGHLATIEDLATLNSVRIYLESYGQRPFYVIAGGVKTSTGQWLWLDGSAVNKNIWGPSQPDNARGHDKCLYIWTPLPADDICSLLYPFLCEI